jgi:hypothetical protein
MNTTALISQIQTHAEAICRLAQGLPDEHAHWKPVPESWSILEVLCHLYDEECLDFRVRLDIILHHPEEPWPSIDPKGWVASHQYSQCDLAQTVANFLAERQKSLAWLKGLESPDWQASYKTPWGSMTAGDMFAAWVAHDLLHLRQLVELHYAYTAQAVHPHAIMYAGEW